MTYRAFFIPIIVLLFLVGGVVLYRAQTASATPGAPSSKVQDWVDLINDIGPSAAYAEFEQQLSYLNPSDGHEWGHLIGKALFATNGIGGLATCNGSFSFGCFHEVIAQGIRAGGLAAVTNVVDACGTNARYVSECEHGTGHGIVSVLGYDLDDIKKAITACEDSFDGERSRSCVHGVFMEYNLRSTAGLGAIPRELTNDDWLYPCLDLTGDAQRVCVNRLPQWWVRSARLNQMSMDWPALFAELGGRCRALPSELEDACFTGIGRATPFVTYAKPEQAVELCSIADPRDEMVRKCASYGAYIFHLLRMDEKTDAVCTALPASEKNACIDFAYRDESLPEPRI
jgi:hypothetical protein